MQLLISWITTYTYMTRPAKAAIRIAMLILKQQQQQACVMTVIDRQ